MGSRWLCRYGVLLVFAPSLLVAAAGEKAHSGVPASVQGRPSQAALPNPQPFYERPFGHQLPVSVTSEGWSITLDGSEPCGQCPGAKAWVFTAVKKDGGGSHKLRLTKSPIQIDQIDLVNESRFVVFGRNTSNAVVVNILALPTGAELDSFMCYNPALSSDHRFLAFLKPFPGHPGPVDITNEYLAYDLTESASSNRVHLVSGVSYDAGIPIYPPGATNAAGEFVAPDEWSAHTMVSSGLVWLDKTDVVAFVDRWQGTNSLVVVDLNKGVHERRVTVQALDTSKIVDMAGCRDKVAPSDFEIWSRNPASLVFVNDISLSGSGVPHVQLTLNPHSCLVSTTVDVPVNVQGEWPALSR